MKYSCAECNKSISRYSAHYGTGKCRSCWQKGKNNNQFKDGRTLKKNYCKNCNKEITAYAIICPKCKGKQTSIRFQKILQNPKNHPRYIDGRSLYNKCRDCRKLIPKQTLRCKKCSSFWKSNQYMGNANPNWKNGISWENYFKMKVRI